jgi:hypothetical protein
LTIFQEGVDVTIFELRSVLFVEDCETHSVEASQSFLSRYPDVTVSRLNYVVNGILREAVLRQPGLAAELGQLSLPVEGDSPTVAETDQQERGSKKADGNIAD